MSSEKNNRIESDGFLDKYEPIDLQKDSFFLELKEINPKFYDGCLQVQDDILEGRVNESDFKDVEDFMA